MPKLEFSPDQNMNNVSPEDVKDAKIRVLQTKAYDVADKTEPSLGSKIKSNTPKEVRPKLKEELSRTNAMGDTYAKGGSVSSRADGIAQRGKTRGKMC
jgi:hypothetical protein